MLKEGCGGVGVGVCVGCVGVCVCNLSVSDVHFAFGTKDQPNLLRF